MFSFVHVDDAAAATVAACERGAPGVYNVCDDEPAPMRDWLPAYARAVGAKRPLRVPRLIARLVAGREATSRSRPPCAAPRTRRRSASSGWAPAHPSWREGFERALG